MIKKNYICKCKHFDFSKKNFAYWEEKLITTDEKNIIEYLEKISNFTSKKILHIGIGNSFFAKKFFRSNEIIGLSVSNSEINAAKNLEMKNYKTFYCDKYSINFRELLKNLTFDYIIDTNLKSYSCCEESFYYYFSNLNKLLKPEGVIITSNKGMKWFKKLVPKLTFNLKNFFHYKLKEIKGDNSNVFSENDVNNVCKKYSLKFIEMEKISYFERK